MSLLIFLSILPIFSATRVKITNGVIEGRELLSTYSGNQSSIIFLGVPHLEPPLGDLRFRKPKEYKKKWEGVLETKEFKPACMSEPSDTYQLPENNPVSEDCLYLNIYTNSFCLQNKNCSVLVVVHGGQMIRGNAAMFHSDVITNNFVGQGRNVIVVTVPYRLGIFGLPNFPGDLEGALDRNLILYDVIEALKWVQLEIMNFGGDPKRTTYFGHSGGGSIGAVLGLLPESEHLYQKMILMSAPWIMQSKASNSKLFTRVAEHIGCYRTSIHETAHCMRQVPAKKLLETQTQIFRFEEPSIADFAIDGKLLKDNPRRLLEAGNFPKKPLLIGTVPYEVRFTQYLRKDGVLDEKELLEICELIGFGVYEHPYAFVEKCFEFYMDNDTSDFIVDDYIIHVPTANLAAHHATEHPVYLYSYSYSGLGPGFTNYIPGAFSPIHSEDFAYIFGVHRTSNFTEKDLQIERIFTGMLTDFVNFGEPKGDDWTRLNPEIMNYFDIDFGEKLEMPGMKYEFYKRQREFWNVISREFGGEWTLESPESFDVFPLREFAEMKNIYLETPYWDSEKTRDVAKKVLVEIEKFIVDKKKKFDAVNYSPTAFSVFTIFITLLILQI